MEGSLSRGSEESRSLQGREEVNVEPAPMNVAIWVDQAIYNWVTTPYGAGLVPTIVREWVGFLAGA